MIYNFHTHTARCGHASGTPEEYIKRAIEGGIKYMGFSDHMPYICTDGYESGYRVPVKEAKEYVMEISLLREKYKGEIDIKIGFEMEYYPKHFKKMLESAIEYGAEYLILGAHFTEEEHPGGVHMIETDSVEKFKEYALCVCEGIKSGVFTYVAHPDLCYFTNDDAVYDEEMRKICVIAREFNIPLEINFLGIRSGRNYPDERFWKIAGEEQSPVTFGFDSHDVLSAYDGDSIEKAEKLIEKYKLNYIGMPEIKLIGK